MLCAETNPVFDARTDFGEIFPVMVFSSFNFVASDVVSALTGVLKGAIVENNRAETMAHLTGIRIAAIYRVISRT